MFSPLTAGNRKKHTTQITTLLGRVWKNRKMGPVYVIFYMLEILQ